MYHLQLPDNWELCIGLQSHITRIATAEETRAAEQECYDSLIYYYTHFDQLKKEELDRLSTLIFRWGCKLIMPRMVPKTCPVYKNLTTEFCQWFEQLKTLYEQRAED
ncbi:MAG: hypothetical protein HEQ40_06940 [Lacibacter sp.]|jgi:hypothetical protein